MPLSPRPRPMGQGSRPARRRRPVAAALTTAVCLVAAACSGDATTAPPGGSAAPGGPGGSAPEGEVRRAEFRGATTDASAPAKVAPEGSWAGPVAGTDAYLAVVSDGTQVLAYFCDSAQISAWFAADLAAAEVVAFAPDGTTLATTLTADGAALTGEITAPDGGATPFTIPKTDDALFRGEQTVSAVDLTDAPLDDAKSAFDGEVDKAAVLAGWIVLPDGTQRGTISLTLTTSKTSKTTTTTARLTQIGTTSLAPAPTLVSASGSVVVRTPLAPVVVLPTPITPTALINGVPDKLKEYTMVTLGDSYAAGEGAPNRAGTFDDGGSLPSGGQKETWSQQPPGHPEVEACHRSDLAAGPLVAADLAAEFPDVKVVHQSFACSGAQIENVLDTRYAGADAQVNLQVTPQLEQVRTWFAGTGPVTFPGQQKKIDALYMNIGGNDLHFADVIASCIAPALPTRGCHNDDDLHAKVTTAEAGIDARYDALDDALFRLTSQDPVTGRFTSVRPGSVFISQAPNPLRDEDGDLCVGGGNRMGGDGGIANLGNIVREESAWVETNMVEVLNRAIARQGPRQGWTVVDTIPAESRTHGVCSTSPWINNVKDGLRSQGKDARIADLMPGLISFAGGLNMSSGMVHPNAAGFRGFANEIKRKVRPQFIQTFRPPTPSQFRVGAGSLNGDIELRWHDNAATEERFEIEESVLENGAYVRYPSFFVAKNSRSTRIDLLGGPYTARYRIRACATKTGAAMCSDWSAPVVASNAAPQPPRADAAPFHFSSTSPRKITASFTDMSGETQVGGPGAIVIVARPPGGAPVQMHIVKAIGSTTVRSAPATGGLTPGGEWEFSLAACNAAGCSAEVARRTLQVVP